MPLRAANLLRLVTMSLLLPAWLATARAGAMRGALALESVAIPYANSTVAAKMISADPAAITFAVLYPRDHRAPGDDVPTLRELSARKELGPAGGRAQALLTGGSAGYRLDTPLGLVIANGRIKSTAYTARRTGTCTVAGVRESQFRQSAVLCRKSGARSALALLYTDDVIAQDRTAKPVCEQAIQAGPMLIDQGRIAVCKNADEPSMRRHAVCISAASVRFVQTQGPIGLASLAGWLSTSLRCREAAILGSEPHVGFVYWNAGGQISAEGQTDSEQPSAILLR